LTRWTVARLLALFALVYAIWPLPFWRYTLALFASGVYAVILASEDRYDGFVVSIEEHEEAEGDA